jgi:putative DNA methylase
MTSKKKLIEVALPLEAINEEGSRRKRKAPAGYPTTLHKWWAQRPVAAARAVIFAQMVDDPSALPDLFPSAKKQEKERKRLFRIIEELVKWENTADERVLQAARDEIWQSWRRTCAENADHPRARELFERSTLPAFQDPFSGSGTIPMEALRLGFRSHASDLNPVAVLISKAAMEIPSKFAGRPPVNPTALEGQLLEREWIGARGIAEDVRYYGQWVRDQAEERIGHLYPHVEVTSELAEGRDDLKPYLGKKLTVVAWLWARTVKSPNPAFAKIHVPLASTFMLSNLTGREAYIQPVICKGGYNFTVKAGKPKNPQSVKSGTKLERANFQCLLSGVAISGDYVKEEAKAGRMGMRMMAVIAKGAKGRVYLSPSSAMEQIAELPTPDWAPDVVISGSTQYVGVKPYGMERFSDLFTKRQLATLDTFCDLVLAVREKVRGDALAAGLADDRRSLASGGAGSMAYADAVAVYLAFVMSRVLHYDSTLCTWLLKDAAIARTFPKQAFQMTWDFVEGNVFGSSSAEWTQCCKVVANAIELLPYMAIGRATIADAAAADQSSVVGLVVSTDPPYYDNVPYADLSDYFYVWLRRALKPVFPELFPTVAAPRREELVAFAFRHKDKKSAEKFFLDGMTRAMQRLAEQSHPAFPVTIYYAFRQTEHDEEKGTVSTGWDTFLEAVIAAGFGITGTWPIRTEGDNRQRGVGSNALASSIVLVCRPRTTAARIATRRDFVSALKSELPLAIAHLQASNIAPVDLAQAAIGPGMSIYTRYERVLDAEGQRLTARIALALINQVLDECLSEQEGEFDAESRWAITWLEESGFEEGDFGRAEQLSKSKNTSVDRMRESGIIASKRGKVRLLKPDELPAEWDPTSETRVSAWESVHQLIRALGTGGETASAQLMRKLGGRAEVARDLAYRLYALSERRKRAADALAYNGLVQSWPEIARIAKEGASAHQPTAEPDLFDEGDA